MPFSKPFTYWHLQQHMMHSDFAAAAGVRLLSPPSPLLSLSLHEQVRGTREPAGLAALCMDLYALADTVACALQRQTDCL